MSFRYASVCSGIEAASVAWKPLGWTPAFFSEIDKFPSAVLAHRFPDVPNLGDMTKFKEWPDAAIDVLVGGTPCQSFSVAGLRKGMADPRGNLALTYLAVAERFRPRWVVWENVPGVRSIDDGHALGSFLGALGELGYGWAYRSLDAQYAGLAQRRERVFVVGYLGDWRRAAEVLFERESLSWNTPACVAARKDAAKRAAGTAGRGRLWQQIARAFGAGRQVEREISGAVSSKWAKGTGGPAGDECYNLVAAPLTAKPYADNEAQESKLIVAHALRGEGFDASEDGTGLGTPLVAAPLGAKKDGGWRGDLDNDTYVPVAFSCKDHGADAGDLSPTLRAMGHAGSHANAGGQVAVAFHENQRAEITMNDTAGSLKVGGGKPGQGYPAVMQGMAVRRLMPVECERLQGFEDDWTQIPWRGKPAEQCPDGPRYKAIGNAMPVNVMRWLGQRIDLIDTIGIEMIEAAE